MKKWKVLLFIMMIFSSVCFASSLKITWDANTENDLVGYNLYYLMGDNTEPIKIDVGNVVLYSITNITTGVKYCVWLTAYDKNGNESEKSDTVCVSTDILPPFKPSGLKVILIK